MQISGRTVESNVANSYLEISAALAKMFMISVGGDNLLLNKKN
jgi:hypothetical protein